VPDQLGAAHQWGDLAGGLAVAGPLLDAAVDRAVAGGASYADVRLSETQELRRYAVSGRAPDERIEGSLGLGARARTDGIGDRLITQPAARSRRPVTNGDRAAFPRPAAPDKLGIRRGESSRAPRRESS
jgi:predicted ATPase